MSELDQLHEDLGSGGDRPPLEVIEALRRLWLEGRFPRPTPRKS